MLHAKTITFLKISFITILFVWLINSNRLDLNSLRIYWEHIDVALTAVGVWLVGLLLGAWRWNHLLRAAGFSLSYLQSVSLTLIGFFFNTVMPGSVGGDLVKAYYVEKSQGASLGLGRVFSSIIMDRFLGFYGLFLLASLSVIFGGYELWRSPLGLYTVPFILGVFFCSSVGLLGLFFLPVHGVNALLGRHSLLKPIQKIYDAFVIYKKSPNAVIAGVCSSLVYQGMCFWYFTFMAHWIFAQAISVNVMGLIFPTGALLSALPLAPGGLGVGHVGFDQLFQLAGVQGGANLFHVVAVGQLLLNLLGVVPYLLFKRKDGRGVLR